MILPVFLITVLSGTVDQLISLALENELRSPQGASPKVWYLASGSLLNSLIFPWITTLLLLFTWQRQKFPSKTPWPTAWNEFAQKFGSQSLIETLRGWGKCIMYSLLLIIPGLWKFLEYSFVPWVVCFDHEYDRGEVDALKRSTTLFRKAWFRLVFMFVVFFILIPLILTDGFEEYRLIWITPLPALGLHLIDTVFHILFFEIITLIFFSLLNREHLNEPDLQLERN